ncbi:hypothetical protein M1446_01200 [Candidatus Dependentiae bacterium]|nr:hypothetical protein [Candidatus Dependentiae bacterium]
MNIINKIFLLSIIAHQSLLAVWFINRTDTPILIYKKDIQIVYLDAQSRKDISLDESLISQQLDIKKLENGIELINFKTILLTDISSDVIILFDENLRLWKDSIHCFSVSKLGIAEKDVEPKLILQKIYEYYEQEINKCADQIEQQRKIINKHSYWNCWKFWCCC